MVIESSGTGAGSIISSREKKPPEYLKDFIRWYRKIRPGKTVDLWQVWVLWKNCLFSQPHRRLYCWDSRVCIGKIVRRWRLWRMDGTRSIWRKTGRLFKICALFSRQEIDRFLKYNVYRNIFPWGPYWRNNQVLPQTERGKCQPSIWEGKSKNRLFKRQTRDLFPRNMNHAGNLH